MAGIHTTLLLYVLVLLVGLSSGLAARLSEGSRLQTAFQTAFLVCLATVGGTTISLLGSAPGAWLGAGATLSVMVLTATCDFSRSRRIVSTEL
ncbi:MAG: hypothetical protein HUU20_08685 [Pirellulales bacterium]|nr:hypothetical protein [Pirellulales bacterium]